MGSTAAPVGLGPPPAQDDIQEHNADGELQVKAMQCADKHCSRKLTMGQVPPTPECTQATDEQWQKSGQHMLSSD